MKKNVLYILFFLLAGLLFACNKDEKTARLEVRLMDAPGDYEAVLIDVREIRVHTSETAGENEGGWTSLDNIRAGVYNLLELTNGIDTLLADAELPAGKISQVRLILGDNNSLKINGNTVPLKTPSAMQSGLKLKVNAVLQEGIIYTLLLDFDAARSIVKAGNSGNYNLKPVIRAVTKAQDGAIKGKINPIASNPAIFAINGTDSTGTYPDETGNFLIRNLSPGTYKVVFVPNAPYLQKNIDNVNVTLGTVKDLGTVQISQ